MARSLKVLILVALIAWPLPALAQSQALTVANRARALQQLSEGTRTLFTARGIESLGGTVVAHGLRESKLVADDVIEQLLADYRLAKQDATALAKWKTETPWAEVGLSDDVAIVILEALEAGPTRLELAAGSGRNAAERMCATDGALADAFTGPIIGIDLGTTNSAVAIVKEAGGTAEMITVGGGRTVPSVVALMGDGSFTVGSEAARQAVMNPTNTVTSVKRLMGRRYAEVSDDGVRAAYEIIEGPDGMAAVSLEVQGTTSVLTPQEISSKVLADIKAAAEAHLGEEVTRAVITVPAYFNDAQRQATKAAGELAGLRVERIVNEPTAAAMAYGLDKGKNGVVAVYDFGGGTFDISILEVRDGVIKVLSTNGDTLLGGDNFDHLLMNHVIDRFKASSGIDVSQDATALQRIREAATQAKIDLSGAQTAEINLPYLSGTDGLTLTIERSAFERMIEPLVDKSFDAVKQALADANLSVSQVDEVVLVGGSTRVPLMQTRVAEYFQRTLQHGVNPDEVVARGAAVQAGVLGGQVEGMLLMDVTPLTLGIEVQGGRMAPIIRRNTQVPVSRSETYTTVEDGQTTVDVVVLQGESQLSSANRQLAKFKVTGVPPGPKGQAQIEVKFDIDSNGIVKVSAREMETGQVFDVVITRESVAQGLTTESVERMVATAAENAVNERAMLAGIEARTNLEQMVSTLDRLALQHPAELRPRARRALDRALERARQAAGSDDPAQMTAALEQLRTAGADLLKKQQGAAPYGGAGRGDGVIDDL